MEKRLELFIGLSLFTLSVATLLVFHDMSTRAAVAVFAIQWSSILVLIAGVDRYLFGSSVFSIGWRKIMDLVLGSFIFHVGLVFYGGAVARTMWYYPDLDFFIYASLAPLGYALYGLGLYGLYETIERELEPERSEMVEPGYYNAVMKSQIVLGITGVLISTGYVLELISTYDIALGAIQAAPDMQLSLWFFFVPWISMFLLFEGICYIRGKTTLTLEVLNRDFSPIYAILVASAIGILIIEIVNVPVGLWEFVNWPYPDKTLFGLPLLVYLSWPLQFPALLATMRAVFPKDERIW